MIVQSLYCSQEDLKTTRINVVKNFAKDLRNHGLSNQKIFETYLTSGIAFASDTSGQMAHEIVMGLRAAIMDTEDSQVYAYKYLDHPEFGRGIKRISDGRPDAPVEHKPLEFELYDSHRKETFGVNLEDLYVLKAKEDVRLFILFDDQNRIISFISMRKGNTVALMKL